ncbi:hypothetical protein [Schlesneria sp. DSM 10557]|uniref:hypothetical protein n=1 Tax=Schlesneria sp. DSM 10557 TaxID=3044399 RepID=UPI0035A09E22
MTETKEMYAVVDLFGHTKIAGQISDYALGGESFVRIDVPAVGDAPAHTRLFGKGAIYSISFVGREAAEAVARNLRLKPIEVYDFDHETRSRLAAVPAITQQSIHDQDDDDFDDGETGIGHY